MYQDIVENVMQEVKAAHPNKDIHLVEINNYRYARFMYPSRFPSADPRFLLYVPKPLDLINLGVFLHEVGHLMLGHWRVDFPPKTWQELQRREVDASRWAIRKLHEFGFNASHVIKDMQESLSKSYKVRHKLSVPDALANEPIDIAAMAQRYTA